THARRLGAQRVGMDGSSDGCERCEEVLMASLAQTPGDGGWTIWPAPAKLNLFLHIVGRRADGYHLLQTAFQLLDWSDTLRFTLRDDAVISRLTPITGV